MEKKNVLDKTLSVHVKISTGKLEVMLLWCVCEEQILL